MAVLFWLIIILVCIFAEIHTNAFIALFVAAGAIIPFFRPGERVLRRTTVLWLIISAALLGALRPAALHRFHHRGILDLSAPSNSSMTNLTGFVEATVGDEGHPGRVKSRASRGRP